VLKIQFKLIFKALPGPFLIILPDTPDFTIAEASTLFLKDSGIKEEDIIGKSIANAFAGNLLNPSPYVNHLQQSLGWVVSNSMPHTMPACHTWAVGEIKECGFTNTPVLDENNQLCYIIHSVINNTTPTHIAALKTKGKNLKKDIALRPLFQSIVSSSDDAIISKTLDGIITTWNQAAEIIFGYPAQQVIGRHISIIIPPGLIVEEQEIIAAMMEGRHVTQYETERVKKDGSLISVSVTISPVLDERGDIMGISKIARDITEQKKAANKIKESGLRYRSLIEQATDAICIVDKALKFIDVNTAACRLFGSTKEEFLQLSLYDILLEEDLKENHLKMEEALNGETVRNERLLRRKDGTTILMEVSTKMLEDGSFILFGRDITKQKEAEESNRFKAKLLNTIGQAVIATDVNGVINFWNRAAEEMCGWAAGEAMGRNVLLLLPVERKESQANEAIQQVLGGSLWSGEFIAKRKNGQSFPVFTTIAPVYGAFNKLSGLISITSDITERKKATEEIKYLANKLLLATGSAGIGIWDWDILKGNLGWDEGMYRLYNINSQQLGSVYDGWLARLHPEDKQRVNEEINLAVTGAKEYNTTFKVIWPDLSLHYIKASGMVERDSAGAAVRMIGVNWDVTERSIFELRLNELNNTLQKNLKELATSNAELEQFAYVASHDLQEPLRMVTSFLTLLKKKYGNLIDDKGKTYIDFAVDGAKRMRQIILDLLDFSRVGKTGDKLESLDLNTLLDEIKILLRKKVEEKKAVITVNKLPPVRAHRSPLRQVFQNLIDNALKYTAQGVVPNITVSAIDKQDHWQFTIQDNGIGIDKEFLDKIFIIFQRLHNKDEFSGTGMGLAITKKIIENYGGKIWVESERGTGSTFCFTLLKQH